MIVDEVRTLVDDLAGRMEAAYLKVLTNAATAPLKSCGLPYLCRRGNNLRADLQLAVGASASSILWRPPRAEFP